jgi:hypothetical protein
MATNTFRNSVYVITTAGWWITTDSSETGQRYDFAVSNFGFFGTDSNSQISISYQSDTSMAIFHIKTQAAGGGYDDVHFATPHKTADRMFINTLTAGTGYFYLS